MPKVHIAVGDVSVEELEARFSAYMNAGAPEPVLEGPAEQRRALLQKVRERGDSQMRSLMDQYLSEAAG